MYFTPTVKSWRKDRGVEADGDRADKNDLDNRFGNQYLDQFRRRFLHSVGVSHASAAGADAL
jgi:hypothetical protein